MKTLARLPVAPSCESLAFLRFASPATMSLDRRYACCVAALAVLTTLALAGCGYTVGNAFQAPVQTVSVSVFGNESFRRGLEYSLTEAIHREIQLRWPSMRIVHEDNAETRLVGQILHANKFALTPTAFDDPRELDIQLVIDVTWEDRRSGHVIAAQTIPISPDAVRVMSQASFAPETGQSRASAERKSLDITARQIVDLMETPW